MEKVLRELEKYKIRFYRVNTKKYNINNRSHTTVFDEQYCTQIFLTSCKITTKRNYLDVPAALKELDKIEMVQYSDGIPELKAIEDSVFYPVPAG
ncbi:MAG: hypothetical protein IKE28_06130 [Solobacterium sp.]|nr:hypothetical protein [Solobacterium sp.]